MITLTQIEYMLAVAKYGHFGKAAKSCFITQPTLSMQIKKAEDDLGIIIFDRSSSPVTATDEGLHFLNQAKIVLSERDILLNIGKIYSKDLTGEIKLGIIPTIAPYLLPLFLKEFSEKYIHLKLLISEMKTSDIHEQLATGDIDIGILATPLGDEGLCEDVLFKEAFHLYVHPDHSLSKHKTVYQNQLVPDGLWLLSDGHCFREQSLHICRMGHESHMSLANIMFQSSNFETLRSLIQRLKGYTLVPELFIQNLSDAEKKIWIRSFKDPVPVREVSLVYHPKHWKRRFFALLKDCIISSTMAINTQKSRKTEIIPIY